MISWTNHGHASRVNVTSVVAALGAALLLGVGQASPTSAETIIIVGEAPCSAPGNVGRIEGNEVTCGCQSGFVQVGTMEAEDPDEPNPAMCALDWGPASADGGVAPPNGGRPPGGGGVPPGGGEDDDRPSCTPAELKEELDDLATSYEGCLTGVIDDVEVAQSTGITSTLGSVMVNLGTVPAAAWGTVLAEASAWSIGTRSCDDRFCKLVDRTLEDCGYPSAVSLGGISSMCAPHLRR